MRRAMDEYPQFVGSILHPQASGHQFLKPNGRAMMPNSPEAALRAFMFACHEYLRTAAFKMNL